MKDLSYIRYFPLILITGLSLCCCLCSASAYAVDTYATLKDEAKTTKRPDYVVGPNFNRISILKIDDANLGIDAQWLKSASADAKKDLTSLITQLADPQLVSVLIHGSPKAELNSQDTNDDDVESYGLLSVLSSAVATKTFSANRPHLKHVAALPVFQAATWQEMRHEKTIETPDVDSVEEYLAGRPIHEFCTEDAGIGLPTSAQMQFSVFDMGAAEASGSSMDLALFHLLEEPDAFRLAATLDEFDDVVEFDDDPWQTVVIDWQQELKQKKHKLLEISSWWKKQNQDADTGTIKFVAALTDLVKRWNNQCSKLSGRWTEGQLVRGTPPEWNLAECQARRGAPLFRIFINDGSAENATTLTFHIRQGSLTASIQLQSSSEDEAISLQILNADERRISSQLVFDNTGRMRGRLSVTGDHVAWSPSGKVQWSGHQGPQGNWTDDRTWDETGILRAAFHFDAQGSVTSLAEWYGDGKPASASSFTADHKEGLQQWWHPNGNLAGDSMWSYGKRFGTSRLKFEHGPLGFDASYIDDQIDGILNWRDDRNNLIMRANFNRGLVEGPLVLDADPQTELARAKFDHGMAEGDVILGQLKKRPTTILPFKSGVLDGTAVFYAPDQSVRMQIPFRSGKIHGEIKTFYKGGARASACKFDTSHLLTWQSWPRKSDINFIRVEGRVVDPNTSRMTQTINDDAKKISATCDGREGIWNTCSFLINGKTFKVADSELVRGTQGLRVDGHPYSMVKCGGTTRMWDLRPWIESGKMNVALSLVPAPGCRDRTSVQCGVAIANDVQVKTCAIVDSEDEDHHDHE